MTSRRIDLVKLDRRATFRSQSFDADTNTIEVVWTTGATVRRSDWDGDYDEALSLDPSAVRLGRLNAGAPFLDTHESCALASVIGSVVPGSASIEGGRGICTVLLSKARGVADTVAKIREGTIRNVSVGYLVHRMNEEDQAGGVPLRTAADWEPLEISAVPIPADASSQIRSTPGLRGSSCRITKVARGTSRARAEAILRKGRNAGFPKLARKHVKLGTSEARFTDILLGRLAERQRAAEAQPTEPRVSKEERDYQHGAKLARRLKEQGGTDTPDKRDEQRVDGAIHRLAEAAKGEAHFRALAAKMGYAGAKRP